MPSVADRAGPREVDEARRPRSILVVEDDMDIRESLRDALEWEGFPVVAASNGREALGALAGMPAPGLILLDLMMPVMNGWELAAILAADPRLSAIPIVVVSAFGEAAGIGARAFIGKPVDLGVLLAVARQHCGEGRADR